ncbi:hypothetical protein F443_00709 [Phytophthora nicotianae P1569]|uniref:DOT1 domain-containing protein n=1 Tax=Phytophthora nicotianae P1569 TaxID=1317065 RepID=V9G1L8_PHYNI|nr:hypothetical protein F443_00709 [Phytophthora nicotianae P1569]
MIGDISEDDVFLDVEAGLGNIVAQFTLQTNAGQCLGIEKRAEVVYAGLQCVRSSAARLLNLRKVRVLIGDILDTPLSCCPPFQAASIVYLNDFLFEEPAKLAVREELCEMPKARVIISTSLYCSRHRDKCQDPFCARWQLEETMYGRANVDKALVRAKVRHDGPGVGMLGNGCVGGSADPKFVQSVVAWDCRAAVQGL